jgi:ankyrin repeat protein
METFKYTSIDLEGSTFRLIRILAAESPSEIQCELFEAWLTRDNNGIPYEALSYTWGGTQQNFKIGMNGSEMYITQNLYEALQHLRFPDQDRILWVDALCIDQSNNKERGHQVQQMDKIYREADQVLVWLGLGTLETDLVMDYINQQHKVVVQVESTWENSGSWKYSSNQSLLRTGLERLLEHQWFTRIWVLQEIANARKASIVCGKKSASARTFAVIPALLRVEPNKQCRAVLDIMPGGSRNNSWWSKTRTLFTLLKQFRSSQATEQQDLIYALLNISSDASSSKILFPDYTKEFEKVIQETISFLLCPKNSTTMLYSYIQWTWEEFSTNLEHLSSAVLICATRERDVEGMELLLKRNDCNISWQDSSGRSPLSWAAASGHESAVKLLLETGPVDVNSKDRRLDWRINPSDHRFHWTPLFWAVESGNEVVVKLLLETGQVDVDFKDSRQGRTTLSWAAQSGHEAVVKVLLETGQFDFDSKDYRGWTPLSWAAGCGNEAVVKLLLETGQVDVNSKDHRFHRTPLSWATGRGNEAVVKLLLQTGQVEVDSRDSDGRTALSWAAMCDKKAVVQVLLEIGQADIDSRDNNGRTILSWAAESGNMAVVQVLLETGQVDIDSRDSYGLTPLSWAAKSRSESVVKLLLETGQVDVNSRDSDGRTILSWAAGRGNEVMVKLLLETGQVDVNSRDSNGRTALSWAAMCDKKDVVQVLLETGQVDIDSRDSYGLTPLSWAAKSGNMAVVQVLLETGQVDIDSRDSYGWTPLSLAAGGGNEAVVKLLLETGQVDVNSKDHRFHRTPLSWAAVWGNEAVVKLLLETGQVHV